MNNLSQQHHAFKQTLGAGIDVFVVISAARFEFTIDKELKKAAAWEEVKAALAKKISRERIGYEVGNAYLG